MYYYRRILWRLDNRKGKRRVSRAASDATAFKKKHDSQAFQDEEEVRAAHTSTLP